MPQSEPGPPSARTAPAETAIPLPCCDAPPSRSPHQAAQAIQNRNRWIVSSRREFAIQQHMAIEQRSHSIYQRILLIVAFHQHRIERSDASMAESTSPFHQPRQQCENRRCISFSSRRLSRRQSDFPLCHRESRKRIHNQQNLFSLCAEIFCNSRRGQRCANSQQWRLIRCRNYYHGSRPPGFAQLFQELSHLASALTHQRQHCHIGRRAPRHHPYKRALAYTAAAEDTHALSAATGQESVDHAHAAPQGFANR